MVDIKGKKLTEEDLKQVTGGLTDSDSLLRAKQQQPLQSKEQSGNTDSLAAPGLASTGSSSLQSGSGSDKVSFIP